MEYVADMLGMVIRHYYEGDIPLYSELIRPQEKPMTAKEIKEYILQRLSE